MAQATAINYDRGSSLLQNALASLNVGDISTACSQLGAYINQVQAQTGEEDFRGRRRGVDAARQRSQGGLGVLM